MDLYIKDLGILIGTYAEDELKKGIDRKELKEYQEKYPQYKYTNYRIINEHGIRKLALYICTVDDFKI